ncbi:hypothetical protein JCM5296_005247 [Sporobolomyces johnsonii]
MQQSASQHFAWNSWDHVVVPLLNESFKGKGLRNIGRTKAFIIDGLRPVWNLQTAEVQREVIRKLGELWSPSLKVLVDYSVAEWTFSGEPVLCEVEEIPEPTDSAFLAPEFRDVEEGFKKMLDLAPQHQQNDNMENRVAALQRVLFRSWEALSSAERKGAVTEFVELLRMGCLPKPLIDARLFANQYPRGTAERVDADIWMNDIRGEFTIETGGWDSLDEKQQEVVAFFPRSMKALIAKGRQMIMELRKIQAPRVERSLASAYQEITPRQAARYKTTVEDWRKGQAFK